MTRVFIQFLMQSQACLKLNGNRDQIEKRERNDINSKNKKNKTDCFTNSFLFKDSKPILIFLNIILSVVGMFFTPMNFPVCPSKCVGM